MSATECSQIHKYVIALPSGGISDIFYDEGEARTHLGRVPRLMYPFWVAFHEVDVQLLVNNPGSIETYCAAETARVEGLPTRAQVIKGS